MLTTTPGSRDMVCAGPWVTDPEPCGRAASDLAKKSIWPEKLPDAPANGFDSAYSHVIEYACRANTCSTVWRPGCQMQSVDWRFTRRPMPSARRMRIASAYARAPAPPAEYETPSSGMPAFTASRWTVLSTLSRPSTKASRVASCRCEKRSRNRVSPYLGGAMY